MLDQQNLLTMIGNERFYSSIVQLKIDGAAQEAIVKDVQMHPAKNVVVHVDLQRVMENETIRMRLPIHFKGESVSPGREDPGRHRVAHARPTSRSSCLPKDLPEFLELDLSDMNLNETKFLADVPLPPGVTVPELAHRNAAVVSIHSPRAAEPEPVAAEAAAAATPRRARLPRERPRRRQLALPPVRRRPRPARAAPKKEGGKK